MNYKETKTLLYVRDVSAGYEGKTIIQNVNIIIKDVIREGVEATGQTIAVLGRSGRGKSTLFKVLTGLIKPMSGQILITDLSTNNDQDARLLTEGDMGFVDQKYTLFRHKTIMDICHYALRKSKQPKDEKEAIIKDYLTNWGLIEHKDKYPNELSGGQKQRVAIIEKMLTSNHFMILDEPFSGLDVGNIEKVKESLERIGVADELNTTIFSTHDIRLAVELADMIYVIGFPEGETISTVLKAYDLKAMGLAWTEYGEKHRAVVKDIRELMLKS
jgi:ABC-type nitrate/sulfonate/bicarbonate transport system ATPase subunit